MVFIRQTAIWAAIAFVAGFIWNGWAIYVLVGLVVGTFLTERAERPFKVGIGRALTSLIVGCGFSAYVYPIVYLNVRMALSGGEFYTRYGLEPYDWYQSPIFWMTVWFFLNGIMALTRTPSGQLAMIRSESDKMLRELERLNKRSFSEKPELSPPAGHEWQRVFNATTQKVEWRARAAPNNK